MEKYKRRKINRKTNESFSYKGLERACGAYTARRNQRPRLAGQSSIKLGGPTGIQRPSWPHFPANGRSQNP